MTLELALEIKEYKAYYVSAGAPSPFQHIRVPMQHSHMSTFAQD